MIDLRKTFARYTGTLRHQKIWYVLNNVLHARQLRGNIPLYRQYGIRRSVFAPINSSHISQPGPLPWLDRPEVYTHLDSDPVYRRLTPQQQQWVQDWCRDGYLLLRGFASPERVAALNAEVEALLASGRLRYNYTGVKIMDALHTSPLVQAMSEDHEVISLLALLLQRPVRPFQSINFKQGSQQKLHSDFIHMATEPRGYLAAAWLALEPIDAGNGPLLYCPGSHRLPYVMLPDFPHQNTKWTLGRDSYRAYEAHIERLVQEQQRSVVQMEAQAGDLFIWHANLLHGGAPILDPQRTRKSMVTHYLAQDVLCYHEITERPTLFGKNP
ncbi:MAG: phytanoyl-CoA dioxygenase family protein [Bacteroidetes bacterium]|nr:phytanoyl-CoA dioxygenase family protein [Bacteroidota bacterium]